jgi:hypothetical protein
MTSCLVMFTYYIVFIQSKKGYTFVFLQYLVRSGCFTVYHSLFTTRKTCLFPS